MYFTMGMARTMAVILAGGEGERLSILSSVRAKPAVPFGGKYRIIDFALSNCVNSEIDDVLVLTQYNPRSLNDHIGLGRPWDLDRNRGGVKLLQPYVSRGGHKLEHGLQHFQLKVTGWTAIDLGASTGGFTDCLLQHGAARVAEDDLDAGVHQHVEQDLRTVAREGVANGVHCLRGGRFDQESGFVHGAHATGVLSEKVSEFSGCKARCWNTWLR